MAFNILAEWWRRSNKNWFALLMKFLSRWKIPATLRLPDHTLFKKYGYQQNFEFNLVKLPIAGGVAYSYCVLFQIKPCDLVLYMKASDDTLMERLLFRAKTSGRSDDNAETILKRLKTFHDHSDPIITNYSSKVKEVSRLNSIHEIICFIFQQT